MSEDGAKSEKLGLQQTIAVYNNTLRLIGAANATALIASGAGYQSFAKTVAQQSDVKVIVLIFILGVVLFAISFAGLQFMTTSMESYFMASEDKRPEWWERLFWKLGQPEMYLKQARREWIVAILAGVLSAGCFMVGVFLVSQFVFKWA